MGKLYADDLANVKKCRFKHSWAMKSKNPYFTYWYCQKCFAKKETLT